MCEFVDLCEMKKSSVITESEFNIAMWERVKYGISPSVDLDNFSLFFDEMMFNMFTKVETSKHVIIPSGYTENSWDAELKKMRSFMSIIVDNNYELWMSDSKDDFLVLREKILKENRELRNKVFKFLSEHIEDLYA